MNDFYSPPSASVQKQNSLTGGLWIYRVIIYPLLPGTLVVLQLLLIPTALNTASSVPVGSMVYFMAMYLAFSSGFMALVYLVAISRPWAAFLTLLPAIPWGLYFLINHGNWAWAPFHIWMLVLGNASAAAALYIDRRTSLAPGALKTETNQER